MPVNTGFPRPKRMETHYYQQSRTPPKLEAAKEKGFRARGAEDKDLLSVLKAESVA
jgi:hypothetical protein